MKEKMRKKEWAGKDGLIVKPKERRLWMFYNQFLWWRKTWCSTLSILFFLLLSSSLFLFCSLSLSLFQILLKKRVCMCVREKTLIIKKYCSSSAVVNWFPGREENRNEIHKLNIDRRRDFSLSLSLLVSLLAERREKKEEKKEPEKCCLHFHTPSGFGCFLPPLLSTIFLSAKNVPSLSLSNFHSFTLESEELYFSSLSLSFFLSQDRILWTINILI